MNNSGNGRGGGGIVREAGEVEAEPTEEAQEVYSDSCQEVSLIAAATEFIKHRDLTDQELLEEKRYLNVEQLLKDENLTVTAGEEAV